MKNKGSALFDSDAQVAWSLAAEPAVDAYCLQHTAPFSFVCSNYDSTQPSKLYRKELIRTGSFCKPSANITFTVTPELLQHWVNTFELFLSRGIRVPVPLTHENLEDNHGYLRAMHIEDDRLVGTIELIGETGEALAQTHDVSIYCPPVWCDGLGNTYTRPILHVALTAYPVIPGLKEFEAIAASILTRVENKKMDWKEIQQALELKDELTDETAGSLILSAINQLKAKQVDIEKELKTTKAALKLSQTPVAPDPMVIKLSSDNLNLRLSSLVNDGKITPFVKDKLLQAFLGQDNKTLSLSITSGSTAIYDDVILALSENDVVKLMEQTKRQEFRVTDPAASQQNVLVAEAERLQQEAVKR